MPVPVPAAPLLTVVTPVLNRAGTLPAALVSVPCTDTGAVELLVVDGGSHDGTREQVLAHPGARLIDAPGSTLYQAINLGVQQARGAWIALLNSDDALEPGAVESLLPRLQRSDADALRARARYRWSGAGDGRCPAAPAPAELTLEVILFGGPAINALVIRRRALERIGAFDETLRIAADREWLLRAHADGWRVEQTGVAWYVYTVHPGSLTLSQGAGSAARWTGEHVLIARRYLRRWTRSSRTGRRIARWHAQETARLALQRLAQRRPREAAAELRRGLGQDPALPLSMIGAVLGFADRRLGRRRRGPA